MQWKSDKKIFFYALPKMSAFSGFVFVQKRMEQGKLKKERSKLFGYFMQKIFIYSNFMHKSFGQH
jgi:hypothetical protein